MVIVMKPEATQQNIKAVTDLLHEKGLEAHLSEGALVTIIGVIGDKRKLENNALIMMEGVDKLVPIVESYKLAGKKFKPERSIITIGSGEDVVSIGGDKLTIMAGPCAVESEEQIMSTAEFLKSKGVEILRGGAFKPRTSPYSFQGLEEEGLKFMAKAREATGLKLISEVVSVASVGIAVKYVDILQIGARNMQNFQLLREVGRLKVPVMLKRGFASTIDEWLNAAEYIMSEGNYDIIMCERGIRTFETHTRNTLDLSAVAAIKELSHLPIVVDPSHATGNWKYVGAMSRAAVAAGADGLMIEVHPHPEKAVSDGPQSLNFDVFSDMLEHLEPIVKACGKSL